MSPRKFRVRHQGKVYHWGYDADKKFNVPAGLNMTLAHDHSEMFTGQVDAHGREIYEGDRLVRIKDDRIEGIGAVIWDGLDSQFVVQFKTSPRAFALIDFTEYEVVTAKGIT